MLSALQVPLLVAWQPFPYVDELPLVPVVSLDIARGLSQLSLLVATCQKRKW